MREADDDRSESFVAIDRSAILFIGSGQVALQCAAAVAANGGERRWNTMQLHPSVAAEWLHSGGSRRRVGGPEMLPGRIVVAVDDRRGQLHLEDLVQLRFRGVTIQEASAFLEEVTRKVPARNIRPSDLAFGPGLSGSPWTKYFKFAAEWVLALFILLTASPVLVLAALAILLESGRPVFFRQQRVGRRGRTFDILKLRTMGQDAEAGGPQFADEHDARITPLGRFLRRTRIDELPQCINVLRGEMALIGPRPERPVFVARFSDLSPYFVLRHSVRPGITGWAQVNQGYAGTDDEVIEKLSYDLYYITHASFRLDLAVFARTFGTILRGKGR